MVVNPKAFEILGRWIQLMPYAEVVILDPFINLHEGQENLSSDMNPVMKALRNEIARKFNVALVIVHHAGRSEEKVTQGRGSSAIEAIPRINYALYTDEDRIKLINTKMSFGPRLPEYDMSRQGVTLAPGVQYPTMIFGQATKLADAIERATWLNAIIAYMHATAKSRITQTDAAKAIIPITALGVDRIRKKIRTMLELGYEFTYTNVMGVIQRAELVLKTGDDTGIYINELR